LSLIRPINSEIDETADKKSVGIDRGIAISYALSDGTTYNLPVKKIKAIEKKIARLQKKSKRQKRRSANKQKTYKKVARLHRQITNVRNDFLQKTTTIIAKNHGHIVLEDLKILNMSKSSKGSLEAPGKMVRQKSGLNKAILRQSWGNFEIMLDYKMKRRHGKLTKVAPHHTSNTCSNCGTKDPESRVSQDHFACRSCGFKKNADINAAINILAKGQLDSLNACGGTGIARASEARTSGGKRCKTA